MFMSKSGDATVPRLKVTYVRTRNAASMRQVEDAPDGFFQSLQIIGANEAACVDEPLLVHRADLIHHGHGIRPGTWHATTTGGWAFDELLSGTTTGVRRNLLTVSCETTTHGRRFLI